MGQTQNQHSNCPNFSILNFEPCFDFLKFFKVWTKGLSFYVNCYFQSDSLKSNSLTSEVKEGPQEAVHEFKITSLFSWSFWAQAQLCDIHPRPLRLNYYFSNYYFATINVKRQARISMMQAHLFANRFWAMYTNGAEPLSITIMAGL